MTEKNTGLRAGLLGLALLTLATATVALVTLVDLESSEPGTASEGAGLGPQGIGAMTDYLDSIIDPLSQAAIDHNHDPAEFLPTDAELDAALASGSMDSPESDRVMKVLRKSYEFFMMRFPGAPGGLENPEGSESSDRVPATDPSAALRPWFQLRIEAMQQAAKVKQRTAESWIPSPGAVEAAASSGSLESRESEEVLTQLREGYAHLGLKFPEPLRP